MRTLVTAMILTLSFPAMAMDMSNWSDKTVCRLAKQSGKDEYIQEATARKLNCVADQVSSVQTPQITDPLLSLAIPDGWQIADMPALMEHEISAVAKAYKNWRFNFGEGGSHATCEGVMSNWDKAIKFSIKNQAKLEPQSFRANQNPPPNIDKCIETEILKVASKGAAPASLQNILLAWAQNENVMLPKRAANNSHQYNYQATSSWSGYASVYAVYYDSFDYSESERELVDNYLAASLKKLTFKRNLSYPGDKVCNPKSKRLAKELANYKVSADTCGSLVWKATTAQLALGLRIADQELFSLGTRNLHRQLHFFDDSGIFITWAVKGPNAYHYSKDVPQFLGIITELLATAGFDFLAYQLPNRLTVKDVFARQFEIYEDPQILYPYVRMTREYRGVSSSEYKQQSAAAIRHDAGIDLQHIVRVSARYVDQYRPDLMQYRDVSHPSYRGSTWIVNGFTTVDPYVIYKGSWSDKEYCQFVGSTKKSHNRDAAKLAEHFSSVKCN
jgi:hypothetical protein